MLCGLYLRYPGNGPQTPNSMFFRRYMIGQRLDYFGVSGTAIKVSTIKPINFQYKWQPV